MATKLFILTSLVLGGLAVTACTTPGQFKTRDQLVSNPAQCIERRFEVYFDNDKATLTPTARKAIEMTADLMRPCHITRVQVTGLADARGGVSSQNQTLSEQRAINVAKALTSSGLPAPAFDIQATGATGATQNGVNDPLRRRTEVVIEVKGPR